MSRLSSLVTALALLLPAFAMADPYFGIGAGGFRAETNLRDIGLLPGYEDDVAAINSDFSSTEVGLQAFAGYRFGSYLGIEIGYADLGEARQLYTLPDACLETGCQSREWTAEIDTTVVQAYLVGYYPLSESVEIYGKAGIVRWDSDFSAFERHGAFEQIPNDDNNPPLPIPNDSIAYDDDGTDLALALGLNLKIPDSAFSIRTEFAWFDIDHMDQAWLLSLNAVYTF